VDVFLQAKLTLNQDLVYLVITSEDSYFFIFKDFNELKNEQRPLILSNLRQNITEK